VVVLYNNNKNIVKIRIYNPFILIYYIYYVNQQLTAGRKNPRTSFFILFRP